jgi:hypothetical protein
MTNASMFDKFLALISECRYRESGVGTIAGKIVTDRVVV